MFNSFKRGINETSYLFSSLSPLNFPLVSLTAGQFPWEPFNLPFVKWGAVFCSVSKPQSISSLLSSPLWVSLTASLTDDSLICCWNCSEDETRLHACPLEFVSPSSAGPQTKPVFQLFVLSLLCLLDRTLYWWPTASGSLVFLLVSTWDKLTGALKSSYVPKRFVLWGLWGEFAASIQRHHIRSNRDVQSLAVDVGVSWYNSFVLVRWKRSNVSCSYWSLWSCEMCNFRLWWAIEMKTLLLMKCLRPCRDDSSLMSTELISCLWCE